MIKFTSNLLIVVFFLSVFGCSTDVKSIREDQLTADAPVNEKSKLTFQQFMTKVPSPLEITKTFSMAKVDYDRTLLRPVKKGYEFPSSSQKALNYGGYLADLAYISLFDQNQDLIKYFVVSRKFAHGLNAGTSFDKVTDARFEKNVGNKDSLLKIMDVAYRATNEYLLTNKRLNLAVQMFAGSWIESLYISIELVKSKGRNKGTEVMFKKIYDQKANLLVLIQLLYESKKDNEIKFLIVEFENLQKAFNDIHSPAEVNEESLILVLAKVSAIRNKIIEE